MRTTKSFVSILLALLPLVYIGGLLIYFSRVNNAFGGLLNRQLGPTMIGLGAIFLLLCLPLLFRVLKLFRAPAPPPAGPRAAAPAEAADEPKSDFDPDAAIARYLARRSSAPQGDAAPPRPSGFGRKA